MYLVLRGNATAGKLPWFTNTTYPEFADNGPRMGALCADFATSGARQTRGKEKRSGEGAA